MKFVFDIYGMLPYALGEPTAVGGSERQKWLLARALVRRGHQVVVYGRAARPRAEQVIEGVRFKWATPRSPFLAWPKVLWAEQPDCWYWFDHDYYLGWLGLLCRAFGVKLAYGVAIDTDCLPRQALHRRKYLWPSYALGMWLADCILLLHDRQMALLPPALRRRARFIPSIAGTVQPAAARGGYVAWVAVLRETKRPHLIPEIAARLPGVRFVVCGPTSLHLTRPEYAAAIPGILAACPNIEYRGQVSPAEAQKVISESALFLSTAKLEGMPNTFLQSWSAGVPVASLELDPGGLIQQHAAGVVAQSVDECAQAIARLLQDQTLNQRLGENGRQYVEANHSEERAVRLLLEALGAGEERNA